MLKQLFFLALILVLLPLSTSTQAQEAYTLTIMHTNDTHASHDDDDGEGGVARMATLVKQIRTEAPNSILVDAGDRFTGSVFHSFYQGLDSAQVMVEMGYDAMVLGSYEFTHGAATLADFVDQLDFPIVVANVDFSNSADLNGQILPTTILDVGSEQIGIIGITTGDSRIRPIPALSFSTDYAVVAQQYIDELRDQGVNKIVLLTHIGYFNDLELATQLDGVDVIVGGDSEILLSNTEEDSEGPYPAVAQSLSGEPVLVVQAGSRNEYLGRLDVTFDANGVPVEWSGDTIFIAADIEPDPDMTTLVEDLRAPIGDFLSREVGESEVLLVGEEEICRFEECSMGNLITDAMLEITDADIAVQNGGGIRASIEPGPVTVDDVLQVLPFNNTFVIFELSGADFIAALENGVSRVNDTEGTGRFLQVAGVRYTYDGSQEEGRRIVSVEVMNDDGDYEPLDPDDVYTIATNDFIFAGGDDYVMFAENSDNGYDFGRPLEEIVRFYIENNSPINIGVEGRITRIDR
ncbi:MAG: 5'-nucleotidase C-terminal domain-containing protein [Chloroflexi bacterium]|nr:5'-nucleotidase C-terminal domain-containing protein [Chloroflexota bacterium]